MTRDVGRRGRLELVFAWRRGRTVLADAYAEPPFRVGRSFPEGDSLRMILAWSAPGIFGGDELEQTIRLEPGARVQLTSQSALQIHPSPGSALRTARLHCRYDVEEDARLHCHWDPLIPFAGASFEQQIELQLAESAQLYWSDAFMAGRASADRRSPGFGDASSFAGRRSPGSGDASASAVTRSPGSGEASAFAGPRAAGFGGASVSDGSNARGDGERWKFASLGHELRVLRGATLEYLERYRIAPGNTDVTGAWVAGDACYFGTALSSGRTPRPAEVETLHARLQQVEGVAAAADAIDSKLLIVRLIGQSGVPFHNARRLVALELGSTS